MNLLNCNHRVRREIMESTVRIRKARGLASRQGLYAVCSFMAEYVEPVARHASLHVRHAPIIEPGYPAPREETVP